MDENVTWFSTLLNIRVVRLLYNKRLVKVRLPESDYVSFFDNSLPDHFINISCVFLMFLIKILYSWNILTL